MNESEHYFSNLQNLATTQDKAKFRALALTFHSTLQRLPALKKELDAMLESTEALDYEALLKRVEPVLQQASDWLWDVDNLPNDLAHDEEMKKFTADICVKLGLTNVNRLIPSFYSFQHELINKNNERQRIINQKQQQEALIIAEKQRQKELEEALKPFNQLIEWAKNNHFYFKIANKTPYELKTLRSLDNDRMPVRSLPDDIDKLTSLTYISIRNTELTHLPESIGNLTQLKNLWITDNKLERLPESIGNLSSLEDMFVFNNQLKQLPESFGCLTRLEKLFIGKNQLTNLPDSIGNLIALQELYVDDNLLTTLPKSIGNLAHLRVIALRNNKLTSLPESIANLTNLRVIDLGNNKLTSLPESIGNLTYIMLDISGNRLTDLPECISHFNSINAENNPLSFWQRLKWSKNEKIKI